MDPRLVDFSIAVDKLAREYFTRAPEIANGLMRACVGIGLGLYSQIRGAKKELAKQWLDEIFRDFCRAHAPWNDEKEFVIWTPNGNTGSDGD
jgi:hypothetical protein